MTTVSRISQGHTKGNSNDTEEHPSSACLSEINEEARIGCQYKDIKNRKFTTKFINKLEKEHKTLQVEVDSIVIHDDRRAIDDISYSEELVGSEKTIYSSNKTGEGKIEYFYQTDQQIQEKISEILGTMDFEEGSEVQLTEKSFCGDEKEVRLHTMFPEYTPLYAKPSGKINPKLPTVIDYSKIRSQRNKDPVRVEVKLNKLVKPRWR